MKKKITALLLALGCALGAGAFAACSQEEKPTVCNHSGVEYILVEVEDSTMLQPRMNCDGCMGICLSDVKKSDCVSTSTEATCEQDGGTVYSYEQDGKIYTSQLIEIVEKLGHDLEVTFTTAEGKTLCEDGGTKTERCKRGCGYTKTETIVPQSHSFGAWEVQTDPTFETEGVLVRTCTGYKAYTNAIVNGVRYTGCGEEETKRMPALNVKEYKATVLEGAQICGEYGKTKFTYAIDGQEFSFVGDYLTKRHVMTVNNDVDEKAVGTLISGTNTEAMDPYQTIVETSDRYSKKWCFVAGEKSDCSKLNKAYFTCADCERAAPLMIKTPHTQPEGTEPKDESWYCDIEGKLSYICVTCGELQEETIEHEYTYTLTIEGEYYTLTGVCANCDKPDTATGLKEDIKSAEKAATCSEKGWIEYIYKREGEILATTKEEIPNSDICHKLNGEKMYSTEIYSLTYSNADGDIKVVDTGKNPHCAQGVGGVMGVFYCDDCKAPVEVKVTVAHEWKIVAKIPATCVTSEKIYKECVYCQAKETDEGEVEGHDWSYAYVGKTDTHYKFMRTCQREGCESVDPNWSIEKNKCTVSGVNNAKPICQQSGTLKISFMDEYGNVTVEVKNIKTAHICLGVEKPYEDASGNPIIYKLKDELGMEYHGCLDGKNACDADSEAEGYFRCDECGKVVVVKVEVEHTPPDDLSDDATEFDCVVCGKKETIAQD